MRKKSKLKKILLGAGITTLSFWLIVLIAFAAIIQAIAGVLGGNNSTNSGWSDNVLILENLPPWVTPEILLTCLDLQDRYGIYASVTIAQAQQEVGGTWNGASLYQTASVDHNLFGLKASGGTSQWEGVITWDGSVGITGTYRHYDSYQQGLRDRARLLLNSSVYSSIAQTALERSGSAKQLEALSKSAWCEGQYNTLQNFMQMYQLERLDNMTLASYQAQYGAGGTGGGGTFNGKFTYYNQGDSAWGSLPYVNGETIRDSGCAATSVAMIWSTYGKNPSITPATVFSIGNSNGAFKNGLLSRDGCVNATNADPQYGCTAVHTLNWTSAMDALDKGGAVMVVGTGKAPFTSAGHWFVIIGYSGNKAYLADPGHRACTWTEIGGNSNGESLSYIKQQTQDMIIFTPR